MRQKIGRYTIATTDHGYTTYIEGETKTDGKGRTDTVKGSQRYFGAITGAVEDVARRNADMVEGGLGDWLVVYLATVEELKGFAL